jgi:hypothetical protein
MLYDLTNEEMMKLSKEELQTLYKNIRDARRLDEGWFACMREAAVKSSAVAYEKLQAVVAEKRGMSLSEVAVRAKIITLEAGLVVANDEIKRAKILRKKEHEERAREGVLLDGSERYYEAEGKIEALERANHRQAMALNQNAETIADLREELERQRLWKNDQLADGLCTIKEVEQYMADHPEEDLEETQLLLAAVKRMANTLVAGGAVPPPLADVEDPAPKKTNKNGKDRAKPAACPTRVSKRTKPSSYSSGEGSSTMLPAGFLEPEDDDISDDNKVIELVDSD